MDTRLATEKQIKFIGRLIKESMPFVPRLYVGGEYRDVETAEERKLSYKRWDDWRRYVMDCAKGITVKQASRLIDIYMECNNWIYSNRYVPVEAFDENEEREDKLLAECGILNWNEYNIKHFG